MARLDEAAFSAFYASHARSLWAYVYRVSGHAADADDIVQEAFLRLLRAGPDTGDDIARRRFLFTVAGNLLVDRWRKPQPAAAGLRPDPEPPRDFATAHDLARTFGELPPRERALLWLAYVEEENHAAIAESLGVGKGSVKVMLFRARERLRDLLRAKGWTDQA